jgi:hypothetical protein
MWTAKAGDLPAHPYMPERILDRPLQGRGQFRDGEFGRVDQGFGCGHQFFESGLQVSVQSRDFRHGRQSGIAGQLTL